MKNKIRLISVICAVCTLLSLLPAMNIATLANAEILQVDVFIDEPKGDVELDFTAECASDAQFHVDNRGLMWENLTKLYTVSPADKAVAGDTYTVYIDVIPNERYVFPSDLSKVRFTVNGEVTTDYSIYEPDYEHDGQVVYITKTFTAAQADIIMNNAEINLSDMPMPNETLVQYISGLYITFETEGMYDNGVSAYRASDLSPIQMTDVFEKDGVYCLNFKFSAIDGYVFAQDVNVIMTSNQFFDIATAVSENGKDIMVSAKIDIVDRIGEFDIETDYYKAFYTPEDGYKYYYYMVTSEDAEKERKKIREITLSLPIGALLDTSSLSEWTGKCENADEESRAVLVIYKCKQDGENVKVEQAGFAILEVYHICTVRMLEGKEGDCYTDGWRSYYKCLCGRHFEDQDATRPIENIRQWKKNEGKIPAPVHSDYDGDDVCDVCNEPIPDPENPDTSDGIILVCIAVMALSFTVFTFVKRKVKA